MNIVRSEKRSQRCMLERHTIFPKEEESLRNRTVISQQKVLHGMYKQTGACRKQQPDSTPFI